MQGEVEDAAYPERCIGGKIPFGANLWHTALAEYLPNIDMSFRIARNNEGLKVPIRYDFILEGELRKKFGMVEYWNNQYILDVAIKREDN